MTVLRKFFVKGQLRPKTNAERQRDFRERHPGYYARLQAQRRAPIKAMRAKMKAMQAELFAAEQAKLVKREPLMLPAPVETIEIPGMTTIDAIPTREELAQLRETTAAHALAKDLPA